MEFREGDKVRILEWAGCMHDITIGKVYLIVKDKGILCFLDDVKHQREALDCITKFEIVKDTQTSPYASLKQSIENLTGNSTLKEVDDILQRIGSNHALRIPTQDKFVDNRMYITIWTPNINKNGTQEIIELQYTSQCEKLTALKNALLWLLEHSNIKKDLIGQEVKAEIEGKVYKVRILEESK